MPGLRHPEALRRRPPQKYPPYLAHDPLDGGPHEPQGKDTVHHRGESRHRAAIALRAARDGANVVIAAKTEQPHPKLAGTIHTAAEEIEKAGGRALPLAVDVRDEAAVVAAVERAVAHFGGLDICVNNASAISLTATLATEIKRYDLMNQVNVRGTFLVSKACIPHLRRAANPHLLMLSPPLDMNPRWFAPPPRAIRSRSSA